MINKKYRASVTIEMSYIMPFILFLIFILINTTFYFHDKIIMSGIAGETLVVMTQYEREAGKEKIDFKEFLKKRAENKLILLNLTDINISTEKDKVKVSLTAQKGKMNVSIEQKAIITQPEESLRKKRKWEMISQEENK